MWEREGLFLTLQSSFQAPLPLVSLVWVASVLSALSTCPSGFFTSHLHLNTQARQCKDLVQGMKMTKRRNTELGMEGRRQDTSSTGGALSLSELSSPITYTPQSSTLRSQVLLRANQISLYFHLHQGVRHKEWSRCLDSNLPRLLGPLPEPMTSLPDFKCFFLFWVFTLQTPSFLPQHTKGPGARISATAWMIT